MYLNLDDAWFDPPARLPTREALKWGPQLRFSAPPRVVEEFYRECELARASFVLYGSGDFHYLTALWVRRVAHPVVLLSFDNHPDWDVRPPKWGCGGWVNRALELPHVQRVSVWGCGNFEYWWPHQIFGNRRAERSGKLAVHPWADDRPMKDRPASRPQGSQLSQLAGSPSSFKRLAIPEGFRSVEGAARRWRVRRQRPGAILRGNWQEKFEAFVRDLRGTDVYVTIDLDCLRVEEAVTNWENGWFTIVDLAWALAKLRESSRIIGGDICGAYSPPQYARWKQRFAGNFDHPKLNLPSADEIRRINSVAIAKLWPALSSSL